MRVVCATDGSESRTQCECETVTVVFESVKKVSMVGIPNNLYEVRLEVEGARRDNAGRCENLSQLGPVARMPAPSAQACRKVASATACVEIPTLDVHRLPCDGVASLRPRLQEAVFTLYGATTRS